MVETLDRSPPPVRVFCMLSTSVELENEKSANGVGFESTDPFVR
jgi:hypothetical protein